MIGRIVLKGFHNSRLNNYFSLKHINRLHNVQRYSFLDQKLFNQDHYQILGVKPGTSKEEIKKQYYKLTKQYHPDVNKGNEDKFKQINAAWDVLSDDKKRQEYDNFRGFFGQSEGQSTGQGGQGFNPFSGFGSNQFSQQNPFHQAGGGQNPFGAGSPFENVDLDQLLQQLKKNGIKLEDLQSHPQFNEFNKMFGLNEEPKNIKDKIKYKVKQEAVKFMLKKMQEKLEKEIQFHKEQKERYQQQANGFKPQNNAQRNYNQQQQNYQSQQYKSQNNFEFDPFQGFKQQQQQQSSQQNYQNNQSQSQNKYEFDPFKGFKPNQNVYSNKPNKQNNQQSNMEDIVNKASNMFSNFFKNK
ncbi:hypothetical protein ABPG74_008897 [Tetrahymena malaccensis]